MKRHPWLPALVAVIVAVTLTSARAANTVDFDALTIADIGHAFNSGTLTSEKLVQLCLARIQAYDRQGPSLRAVLTLNPKALDTAQRAVQSAASRTCAASSCLPGRWSWRHVASRSRPSSTRRRERARGRQRRRSSARLRPCRG
jgi:hypothetical protein